MPVVCHERRPVTPGARRRFPCEVPLELRKALHNPRGLRALERIPARAS